MNSIQHVSVGEVTTLQNQIAYNENQRKYRDTSLYISNMANTKAKWILIWNKRLTTRHNRVNQDTKMTTEYLIEIKNSEMRSGLIDCFCT